ncbi:MAG: hypothetical protein NTY19_03140 [Planctomycetota bacterium]|nr:hypothetical protein [Planctomycetota bacterium]
MQTLEEIVLEANREIKGEGIAQLDSLQNLRDINVAGLNPGHNSDDTLAAVCKCARLTKLTVSNFLISDGGLAHISELPSLTDLRITCDGIHAPGLAHLNRLRRLKSLDLSYSDVSDDALASLQTLTSLQRLDLTNTRKVTEAGVKSLQAALPTTEITKN